MRRRCLSDDDLSAIVKAAFFAQLRFSISYRFMSFVRRLKQSAAEHIGELLFCLLQQSPALPAALVGKIDAKYGEAQLLQRRLLRWAATDEEMSPSDAAYSLLGRNDIDGLLLYCFARGGFTNRVAVDIGAGDCLNGNTANLVLFHGFSAFLIDGDERGLDVGRQVYQALQPRVAPRFIHAFLDTDGVNELLRRNNVPDEVDLLSIDIDSIDVFIAERLRIAARVVIVEFNNLWGPDESFSVPNSPGFQRELDRFLYGGASLAAFDKVLTAKGYKLVAVSSSGYDAVFVRDNDDFKRVPQRSLRSLYDENPVWRSTHAKSLHDPIRSRPWQAI